jgi:uncharacterized membrane protein
MTSQSVIIQFLFAILILLIVVITIGYFFKVIIENYAFRSKADIYLFLINEGLFCEDDVCSRNIEIGNILIKKYDHLAQSAGNWSVPVAMIYLLWKNRKQKKQSDIATLDEKISNIEDDEIRFFLHRRRTSLAKYLLLYLAFGSPVIPFSFAFGFFLIYSVSPFVLLTLFVGLVLTCIFWLYMLRQGHSDQNGLFNIVATLVAERTVDVLN